MSTSNMVLSVCDILYFAGIFLSFLLFVVQAETKERFKTHGIKVSDAFFVKPGGSEYFYEDTWDDFTCKFSYIAQGGTHEQWTMSFARSKDKRHCECIVERPEGVSYLLFQKFQLEIGNKNYDLVEGITVPPMDNGEYTYEVDKSKRAVHNRSGFMGLMQKIEAYAVRMHEEL